ncbi:glutathione S-transferase [Pseudaminobacter salicylatoxidans]|uniref:Glutathione S-transferase n=1 Tax=Pseudaminobacter salicylatoxidans TaxID=93369 RepID=A0A316BSW3_PSESE|nr:glutathione S-transferase family protein [Pseudaminobacter salicylatoxidans]PWJ76927.1 glutathione S-transferase [Pseudaminobacter salicylatoxidans]
MSLTLHFHPLASYCHKTLIAFYENAIPFAGNVVDLGDPASGDAFRKLWPVGKMPVLRDEARDRTVPESTIIIEYLARYYPGPVELVPSDPELAWKTRLADRFYDLYVHEPMQRIVGDRLRPAGRHDTFGVEQARASLRTAYDVIETDMAERIWATGESYTLADCAASPALFYANEVLPFTDTHKNVAAYFKRLKQRPSYARVLAEAEPYMHMFPRQNLA